MVLSDQQPVTENVSESLKYTGILAVWKWLSGGVMTMSIAEIYHTMSYGPAPESAGPAQAWLDAHDRRFGLFVDGAWTEPDGDRLFDTVNPANGKPIAQITQATQTDVDAA